MHRPHRLATHRLATHLVLLSILTASAALAGHRAIASRWTDGFHVAIDGRADEWDDQWTSFKKAKLHLSVANDQEFLYLTLSTFDRGVRRQLLLGGLTVWIDPAGGEEPTYGLRFPLGCGGSPQGGPRPGGGDREAMRERLRSSLTEMELLGPGVEPAQRVAVDAFPDLAVAFGVDGERTVYELRLPLAGSEEAGWAADWAAGGSVGIHLDSPALRQGFGGERRGGPRVGGFGGPGDARGGGATGGGRPAPPRPIDLPLQVRLAVPP